MQDWPATIATRDNQPDAWNYHFTGWGTNMSLGYLAVFKFLAKPQPIYNFANPEDTDRRFRRGLQRHAQPARRSRSAPRPSRAPSIAVMEHGIALPFGWLTKIQATRANVQQLRAVPHPAHVQRLDGDAS